MANYTLFAKHSQYLNYGRIMRGDRNDFLQTFLRYPTPHGNHGIQPHLQTGVVRQHNSPNEARESYQHKDDRYPVPDSEL